MAMMRDVEAAVQHAIEVERDSGVSKRIVKVLRRLPTVFAVIIAVVNGVFVLQFEQKDKSALASSPPVNDNRQGRQSYRNALSPADHSSQTASHRDSTDSVQVVRLLFEQKRLVDSLSFYTSQVKLRAESAFVDGLGVGRLGPGLVRSIGLDDLPDIRARLLRSVNGRALGAVEPSFKDTLLVEELIDHTMTLEKIRLSIDDGVMKEVSIPLNRIQELRRGLLRTNSRLVETIHGRAGRTSLREE